MTALLVRTRGPSRPWRTSGPSIPVEARDGTFDRSRAHHDNPADAIRARRLLDAEIQYIDHPSFDDPSARDAILAPTPGPDVAQAPRRTEVSAGLLPYLASLYHGVLLLSREEEAHLFRKMNYLKSRASRLRDRIDPSHPRTADLDEIERSLEGALAIKTQIVRANLRLVVSIAKRHLHPHDDLFERVSDGNYGLMCAVERFDYSRGNKFSTYATWVIRNEFVRAIRGNLRQPQFLLGHDEVLEAAADPRTTELEQSDVAEKRHELLARLLARLGDRERWILVGRYGIGGGGAKTLVQLGRELGVTKERVRQIETVARNKLRRLARTNDLVLLLA
jgi:RNA polymerase primary sigma factor